MYDLQRELGGDGVVLGVDEVGRGAIAGPLTVCAVALPASPRIWGLNDSKQLTPARREALAAQIAEVATAIGIAHIEPASIDAVGMSSALRMAMANAIEDAGVNPDCVLIDGNPVHVHPREKTLVKGDARVACIAAASIVAKVTRDAMMVAYDAEYPEYHLAECKGYGSAAMTASSSMSDGLAKNASMPTAVAASFIVRIASRASSVVTSPVSAGSPQISSICAFDVSVSSLESVMDA